MATLHEYFLQDFPAHMSVQETWKLQNGGVEVDIVARMHLDFDSNSKFLSFYIAKVNNPISAIAGAINNLNAALKLCDETEIQTRLPGEELSNSNDLRFSGRIFFYSEASVDKEQFARTKEEVLPHGLFIRYRDNRYVEERSRLEKPLAFISHDSRDKDAIASHIAIGLSRRMCPVWYDEYSLKVGDSLRESIEKGLRECKKCILILSPNFLKNSGWTKTEFNAIFTREILEEKKLVLPVWCSIDKRELFEYSPMLLDRVGLNWERGIDEVVNKLHQAIISEQ